MEMKCKYTKKEAEMRISASFLCTYKGLRTNGSYKHKYPFILFYRARFTNELMPRILQ
ncbi:hypothetical protein NBRC111894_1296 [Sporolactobacillus inulinus]|uniref:Uncharacterized protein n=1 Tax=Sporolactobacillus inulinus TaxID=2078 RepID=A0A4Y1Z9L0_9BACL|nr:hypothetical protein NBRC111894_1296 [Sporolactobacillus inulinus]